MATKLLNPFLNVKIPDGKDGISPADFDRLILFNILSLKKLN
ncbi:MAG: hypothetical protein ACOYL6_10030 [Bacteriovoracaceae bacterium]